MSGGPVEGEIDWFSKYKIGFFFSCLFVLVNASISSYIIGKMHVHKTTTTEIWIDTVLLNVAFETQR